MRVIIPDTPAPAGRVALLIPRWTDRAQSEPQGVPFRSFTMGGALRAAGYEVVFFDQEHDLDRIDRFGDLLDELDDCLAVFIWMNESYPTNQFTNAHRLTTELKRARPAMPVIVGGEMITICPSEFFDIDSPVDYFLQGYGEESSLRLLQHLQLGTRPDDVAGLVWRDGKRGLQVTPPAPKSVFLPEYLDLYRLLDLSCYVQTGGVFGNDIPTLSIATGRGCTKGCPFCCWSNHPSRILGADPTFELMSYLQDRYGINQFHIGELDFFMSRKRALDLAGLIAEHRPDIGWYALGSPIDLIEFSDEDWDRLRDGGLLKLELGSESGSTRVLRSIGKQHDAEDIFTISEKLLQRGIVPMNNFLFGFPDESFEDRVDTLALIERLRQLSSDRSHFTYRHYQPVWGTAVGDRALSQVSNRPRRIDHWLEERPRYADETARTMPWLPVTDERELKRLINYDLPLATSMLTVPSTWRRGVYRALRARARRGLKSGGRRRLFDRWIYDNLVARRLDRTYIP